MNTRTDFKSNMFVYAAERYSDYSMQTKIKVFIPQTFLVDKSNNPIEFKSQKGNTSIFINSNIPALSQYSTKYNYMTLPIMMSDQMYTKEYTSNGIRYIIEKGTRFMTQFVNDNPKYGLIVVRC